ncbi:hypothetical protein PTKIN_Ptkin06aG0216500 [Pterospermum kingtungense]
MEEPNQTSNLETQLGIAPNGQTQEPHDHEPQVFCEDYDSTCSTPYVSAPSSPGRAPGPGPGGGFFYSAPASPMHFAMTSVVACSKVSSTQPSSPDNSVPLGFEFEFSARFGSSGSGHTGSMSSADELFFNGQIRPMKLSTHLERPQALAPLMDVEHEDDEENEDFDINNNKLRGRDLRQLRDKSLRRRTRSMSPLRNANFGLNIDDQTMCYSLDNKEILAKKGDSINETSTGSSSMSASSSRSSSAGRSSKRWVFLKDFLRSKSEGRSNNKYFWSTISFAPAKEKKPGSNTSSGVVQEAKESEKSTQRSNKNKPVNGLGKRRVPPSPHELHYTANRAQAEEMRKKTFLPYRQGLLGCLGFSSKGYGAMNGLARAFNPVSSR